MIPLPRFPVSTIAEARVDTLRYIRSGQYWVVMAAACLITGYTGPFGSAGLLPLVPRVVYWSALLAFAILLQTYLSFLTYRALSLHRGTHFLVSATVAGLIGTPIIALVAWVFYLNFMSHGPAVSLDRLLPEVGVPVVILTVLVNIHANLPPGYADPRKRRVDTATVAPRPMGAKPEHDPETGARTDRDRDDLSPVLAALPPDLGRDLVSIRADNHHLVICTAQGEARLLMRLRDADVALSAYPGGLRVHRSWWVNMAHAQSFRPRPGGGGVLTLDSGATLPVSRAMADTVAQVLAARG